MVKFHMIEVIATTILLLSIIPASECSKKPVSIARKEDIPFIKCQVCEKLVAQLHHQVRNKKAQISPKKVSEYEIIELAENVCNLKKEEADWILKIDIVEQGETLKLVEQESEGQCNSECKTIERACQEIMGYSDTDIAEFIYNSKPNLDTLMNFFCKDLTKVCNRIPPPVPKDRTHGEAFIPKSSKEAEMDKLLKSMEGMPGAGNMKMYSREDLMSMKNFGNDDADDDNEDDDDDGNNNFPSNLGKVLREKESKRDWRQWMRRGVTGTANTLKQQADKLRKWWGEKKVSYLGKNTKTKPEL